MRHSVSGVLAAVVTAVGAVGVLAACSGDRAAEQPAPSAQATRSASPDAGSTQPATAVDRAPLGLEIRYVDENGKFVTVSPEDFPR